MWSSHRCLRFRTAVMKSYEGLVGSSRYEATETFLFASLTALSASWHRWEAGRSPAAPESSMHHQYACCRKRHLALWGSCVGGPVPLPPLLSTLIFALGYARGCHSTWGACSRSTRQRRDTVQGTSCRPVEQTDVVCVFELARRHVILRMWSAYCNS